MAWRRNEQLQAFVMLVILFVASVPYAVAQAPEERFQACPLAASSCVVDDRVLYFPDFFSQFNPITALDLVLQVPGFSIDAGDSIRGFGGAAGNVLIDGQRPSTKSTTIFDYLSRIGAGDVARIELIRGGTGGLDVNGQVVVVNVVRNDGANRTGAPWEFVLRQPQANVAPRPALELFYNGAINNTKYLVGIDFFSGLYPSNTVEDLTRFTDGVDEFRLRAGDDRFLSLGGTLNVEHTFSNGDIARLNFEAYDQYQDGGSVEERFFETGAVDIADFSFVENSFEYEIGIDYEHALSDQFKLKVIGLRSRDREMPERSFEFQPAVGLVERSVFATDSLSGEDIGRLEFEWSGWKRHQIQFGGEFAKTFIDSTAALLFDDGSGAGLVPIAVDGANTRVRELRGEVFINNSSRLGANWSLDSGFAVELSSIAQTGDAENSRFFVYPKPFATLTYAMTPKTQIRLSAARRVNQLSFGSFVSAVNFDDEDVDFGNPDLQPQRSWESELSLEQRFGKIGVVTLTGFYNYIEDVEDLLPIADIVEVPGNIGEGAIYGASIDTTLPLSWLGLANARLEAEATLRGSSVTDPLTGLSRDFSFTANTDYNIEFRHDVPRYELSWGWDVRRRGERLAFGLDELSRFQENASFGAFIETTAIDGVKVRIDVSNLTNRTFFDERTVFQGARNQTSPSFREFRRENFGRELRLTLSGNL